MPLTVILSDSCGASLGTALRDILQEDFKSFSFPGAMMTELIFRSADCIWRFKPKLVIILGGINDLTVMDKATRKVSVRFSSVEKSCEHFTDIIINARALLRREYPEVLFSFGGMIGMDLMKYNGVESGVEDQQLLNVTVLEINRLLKYYNYYFDSPHEYFTTVVHRWMNGSCTHH